MSFEQKLKETRILKGYTQSQLADLIGVKPSTYCNYEKGRRKPVCETLLPGASHRHLVSPRPSSSQFTLKTGKNHPVLPLLFEKMSEK